MFKKLFVLFMRCVKNMFKKLFVLFIVLVLVIVLLCLFLYDKNILEAEALGNEENITEENLQDTQESTEDEMLGRIIIEKISLDAPIKEGSSIEILKNFVGHIEETAKYDGNVGLAAHNRGNEYSYFARINELVPGDEIIYQTKFGERKYIVNTLTEILETDWSLLEQDQTNKLTLITCIKNKVNQRLCVQAIQKEI